MATPRLLLVAALLALPLWVAQISPAGACTYDGREVIRVADLIVVGTVGEILILPPESVARPEELAGRTPVEIKFSVTEYIKGSGPSTLLIYRPAVGNLTDDTGKITSTGDSNTSCGSTITTGDQFLGIFVKEDSLRYRMVGFAMGLEDKAVVLDVLSTPDALPPTGSGPPHHSGPPLVPLAAASLLAAFGLAANAAFVLRRRS